MSTSDDDFTDPLRTPDVNETSSEEEYHDADGMSSPQDLDNVVLTADHNAQDNVTSEERMVFDDSDDEDTASPRDKVQKKRVSFKNEDSLAVHFPSGRLWEPGVLPYATCEEVLVTAISSCRPK